MEERIAISLGHFYHYCDEFPPLGGMGWSFRGQANADWQILPKAGRAEFYDPDWDRKTKATGSSRPPKDLGRFRAWRDKAIAFCKDLPANDFECLAYAQHHGLATRLLDWTHNPLVALYFAVRELSDVDGAVYAYYNNKPVVVPEVMPLAQLDEVVVFFPRPVHQRILIQGAFFTVHPKPHEPMPPEAIPKRMASYTKASQNLVRIRVPAQFKSAIQGELNDCGVNNMVLFPGIEGLSDFINWETARRIRK